MEEMGSFGEGVVRHLSLVSTSGLTYNNIFAEDHDVEVSGLFEYLSNKDRSFGYTGYGIDGRLPNTIAGVGNPGTYVPALSWRPYTKCHGLFYRFIAIYLSE